jgi:hypothetical protein
VKLQNKIPQKTILETAPPVALTSQLALKEGNSKKPIYMMHKWWARRLGPVFRMLLLGATHSSEKSPWLRNGAFFEKHDLSRIRLFDPFVGGGTSMVEASKCGASVIGVDSDHNGEGTTILCRWNNKQRRFISGAGSIALGYVTGRCNCRIKIKNFSQQFSSRSRRTYSA